MLVLCFSAAFIVNLSVGLVFLALPLHAIDRFGAGNFEVGLLSAAAATVYIGASFFSGRISERLPIKWQLIGASVVLGGGFCAFLVAPAVWVLVVLQVVNGIAMGVFWAPLEAVVSRLSPPDRVRANMGWYNLSWSAGMTIGYFSWGSLGDMAAYYNWGSLNETTFRFGTLTLFLAAAMLMFLRAPDARPHLEAASPDRSGKAKCSRRRFFLMTSWLGVLVAYVGVGAARQLFPKLARELKIDNEVIGYIYGSGLLAQTVIMAAMGRFHGWHYRKQTVLWGGLGLVVAGLLVAKGNHWPLFAAGHILLGVTMAVVYSSSLYYSMEIRAEAHRNTSVHESLIGVGLTSSVFMGWAADRASNTRLSFYIAAGTALVFVTAYLAWAFAQRTRERRVPEKEPLLAQADAPEPLSTAFPGDKSTAPISPDEPPPPHIP